MDLTALNCRVSVWEERFLSGMNWMSNMVHPDGEISFFNDSTLGSAPTFKNLTDYAKELGLKIIDHKPPTDLDLKVLKESGFGIINGLMETI